MLNLRALDCLGGSLGTRQSSPWIQSLPDDIQSASSTMTGYLTGNFAVDSVLNSSYILDRIGAIMQAIAMLAKPYSRANWTSRTPTYRHFFEPTLEDIKVIVLFSSSTLYLLQRWHILENRCYCEVSSVDITEPKTTETLIWSEWFLLRLISVLHLPWEKKEETLQIR